MTGPKPGNQTQSQGGAETTRLTPAEETAYRRWLRRYGITDADSPEAAYDYRGAFKAGVRPEGGHWPDTFKRRLHPTFSVESQYARPGLPAGSWQGERFTPAQNSLEAQMAIFRALLRQYLAGGYKP